MGGTFSSVAGNNLKLLLYNATDDTIYGLGISSSQLDYVTTGSHVFYSRAASVSTERLRINDNGRLLVNASGARFIRTKSPLVQVETDSDGTYVGYSAINNTNDTGGAILILGKSRGTAAGFNTIVAAGDTLGDINFFGANGTSLDSLGAQINVTVDDTPGIGSMPGRLVFKTTAIGAVDPTERMRIDSSGRLSVFIASATSTNTPILSLTDSVLCDFIVNLERGTSLANSLTRLTCANSLLAINLGGSERARIDGSGRLLVGTSSDSGGALFQVNDDRIRISTAKTPASASAAGTAGEICWDTNYIYVCTATNTWKRTAITTW